MSRVSPEQLRALAREAKARADATLNGPWAWEHRTPNMSGASWVLRIKDTPGIRVSVSEYQHGPAFAEFVTHAREDVPALALALVLILDMHHADATGATCVECRRAYPCPTIDAAETAFLAVSPSTRTLGHS